MSHSLGFTEHAAKRMAQRGIRETDVEIILSMATEVEGGYLVRKKDFEAFDRELKRRRDHARRLVGKRLVIEDDRLVTAHHADRAKRRRPLRRISAP
jgi:hypothetical protein